jgi:hypothetical protein
LRHGQDSNKGESSLFIRENHLFLFRYSHLEYTISFSENLKKYNMKKISILLLFSCIYGIVLSQSSDRRKTITTFPIYLCQLNGTGLNLESQFYAAPEGGLFRIISTHPVNNAYYIIEFSNWTSNNKITDSVKFFRFNYDEAAAQNPLRRNSLDRGEKKFFAALKTHVDSNAMVFKSAGLRTIKFTAGTVIMPLKLRLKDFDFTNNFSLGLSGGAKWRISNKNDNYVNLLASMNIGFVDLDSFSTRGKVIGQPVKNIGIFSPALGLVFEFEKAQIGIFVGKDYLSKFNQEKYNWRYQKRTWLSIGFGFSLFSTDANNPKPKTSDEQVNGK